MNAAKILLIISTGGFLAINASNALAHMPPPKGWYIQGNVGTTNQDDANYGIGTSTSTQNANLGLNANVGYKFFPYFALEGGYTRYSRISIEYNGTTVAKNNPSAWDITTKTILPIQDSGFSFYAKLGVVRLTSNLVINNQDIINANRLNISSGNSSATGLLYGLGGEWYFWGNTAVHLSWVKAMGNNTTGDMELTAIGLSYIIG